MSGEDTLLVSRVRHAEPCTVRAYLLRGFHSAVIVINIRVLRASRTDRRRSRLSSAILPAGRIRLGGFLSPLQLLLPVVYPFPDPSSERNRDKILAMVTISLRAPRETLSSTRRVNFSTAKLARRREGQNERKRNRGSLRLRLHARGGWFALRRFSYVLSAASALILRRA